MILHEDSITVYYHIYKFLHSYTQKVNIDIMTHPGEMCFIVCLRVFWTFGFCQVKSFD